MRSEKKSYDLMLIVFLTGCFLTGCTPRPLVEQGKLPDNFVLNPQWKDVDITVSPNMVNLKNFKVLVGPVQIVTNRELDLSYNIPSSVLEIEKGLIQGGATVVDRTIVKEIFSELRFQHTGAISPKDVQRLGELSGAGIITLALFDITALENKIFHDFTLKAISVESGEVLAIASSGILTKLPWFVGYALGVRLTQYQNLKK